MNALEFTQQIAEIRDCFTIRQISNDIGLTEMTIKRYFNPDYKGDDKTRSKIYRSAYKLYCAAKESILSKNVKQPVG